MSPRTRSGKFLRTPLVLLGCVFAAWAAVAAGQQAVLSPPLTAAPPAASLSTGATPDLAERLGKLEARLDWLMNQNQALLHENQVLAGKVVAPIHTVGSPVPQGVTSGPLPGMALTSGAGSASKVGASDSSDKGGKSDSKGTDTEKSETPPSDPEAVGRAQEIGNLHLGKVALKATYDFDDGGFRVATEDGEYSFAIRGMTQLDGMLYGRPAPGAVSSGFYNPRSRIYFEGQATKPISWEFSFQNFYDTVSLLDAYVNFNYDPRFQVQLGRYKNPFTYEFYHQHIWDLMAPERSLFANNFEANRRFGLMAHGDLFDDRLEYALGSFDTQRNSLRPFNNRQDFEAFLNAKPFYPREAGFVLRDLQFGGSVDLGNEHQPPVPAVLRTNQAPGGAAVNGTAASNAAGLPFLAFGPNVLERGPRALWELHLAYYYGGLSFVSALQGGHESYANGAVAPPVRVPLHGWFVQAGYLLTGETIRDRTNVQPLHPFDVRPGHCSLGAWEVTARYSELILDGRVFTEGLADPTLWTNHVELIDVGANWYLNQFIRVYLGWERSLFGSLVFSDSGHPRRSNDLFWLRTQVYF